MRMSETQTRQTPQDTRVVVREAQAIDAAVIAALYWSLVQDVHINVRPERLQTIAAEVPQHMCRRINSLSGMALPRRANVDLSSPAGSSNTHSDQRGLPLPDDLRVSRLLFILWQYEVDNGCDWYDEAHRPLERTGPLMAR